VMLGAAHAARRRSSLLSRPHGNAANTSRLALVERSHDRVPTTQSAPRTNRLTPTADP
jgi:hypothetical protein